MRVSAETYLNLPETGPSVEDSAQWHDSEYSHAQQRMPELLKLIEGDCTVRGQAGWVRGQHMRHTLARLPHRCGVELVLALAHDEHDCWIPRLANLRSTA